MEYGNLNTLSPKNCYLCNSTDLVLHHDKVRDRDDIKVLRCLNCGLVALDSFDHINSTFYEQSMMFDGNTIDPSVLLEQEVENTTRRLKAIKNLINGKNYVDFGCGAGGVLQGAKGIAASVLGIEPDLKWRRYLKDVAHIDTLGSADELHGHFDVISLFHVLEHIQDPRVLLEKLALRLSKNGTIVIEVPNENDALLNLYASTAFKNFTYWSCHLYSYTQETLSKLLNQSGYEVKSIEYIQRYSIANHQHWLSKGKPNGHNVWKFIDTPELNTAYKNMLIENKATDTIIAYAKLRQQ